ncbi:MAG: leucine-rich repeat domain-containing protein [Ruminococcaceae bacterium]|nr:leucine-rich repeat domain-containing protein [Oscillospiraceae bacterium]
MSDFIIENGILEKYTGTDSLVTVPESVTEIKKYAFSENGFIREVIIPDTVLSIGAGCFYGCNNLKKVRFPKDLGIIPPSVCAYCKSLEEVVYPENLSKIEYRAFFESGLRKQSLPGGIVIDKEVFYECKLSGCEKPPVRKLDNVHFTIDGEGSSMYFKTYSEEDEARFVKKADEWRYDTSYEGGHETWYEDKNEEFSYFQKLNPEEFVIQNGELAGVCMIGGFIESSVWRTDRYISLQTMFFDKRNGVDMIKYKVSSGNDEYSSSNGKVWRLVKKAAD